MGAREFVRTIFDRLTGRSIEERVSDHPQPRATISDVIRPRSARRPSLLRFAVPTSYVSLIAAAALLGGLPLSSAAAEGCPNETVRVQQAYGKRLPDCRAYEQVTPLDKNGANPTGDTNFVEASEDGERLIYLVPAGLPGAAGEASFPSLLSARSSGTWVTEGLLPATTSGASARVLGWTEDLALSALEVSFNDAPSSEGLQLRQTAGASFTQAVPAGYGYHLAGFSADKLHVIFETEAPLLPDAAPGVDNLYEWNANKPASERLSLAGVLPDGSTPTGGSFAGAYNWSISEPGAGGAIEHLYTQNTISADGAKVVFTTGGTEGPTAKQIYVRENGVATVQASGSHRTEPDPNGVKPAAFMAATPDGSKVFFTSCQKLTNDSTAVSTTAPECTTSEQGQDLYEYDTATNSLTDLTNQAVSDPATAEATHGAAVQGVLGVSTNGSYVYFAANGVLASGATPGSCLGVHTPEVGACNLYVWHEGHITYIARQNAAAEGEAASDTGNWRPSPVVNGTIRVGEKTSRVTPDGLTLLFRSREQLTSYDNRRADGRGCNNGAKPGGEACGELYRYTAQNGGLACVSCNPMGAPPTGPANLQSISVLTTEPETPAAILTRNLSSGGTRVFFESPDPLVPQDTNGRQDVYEWEADGTGSCQQSAGCVFLLSSGQGAEPTFLADASANGSDVFLFTSQQLVGQDQDQLVDIYDAREAGGIASQNLPAQAPCSGEGCRGPSRQAPSAQTPASAAVSGPGNPRSSRCKTGFVKKHGKCKRRRRGHSHHKHRRRSHHKKLPSRARHAKTSGRASR